MPETTTLSSALKQEFDRDGFVSIPGFVGAHDVSAAEERLGRYIRETVPHVPPNDAYYEVKGQPDTLKQMHRMMDHEPWFRDFFVSDPFIEVAKLLLGTDVVPKGVEFFGKPPRIGKPTHPTKMATIS